VKGEVFDIVKTFRLASEHREDLPDGRERMKKGREVVRRKMIYEY
jgi:hypothetical protein